jgi:chaperonin cofactor prefoldin
VLIEMTPEDAKKNTEMELESLELRMKALEKQEQATKDKLIEMRNKIYGQSTDKTSGVAK